jgi:hypothetical protein
MVSSQSRWGGLYGASRIHSAPQSISPVGAEFKSTPAVKPIEYALRILMELVAIAIAENPEERWFSNVNLMLRWKPFVSVRLYRDRNVVRKLAF